jgi:hypothetical protein
VFIFLIVLSYSTRMCLSLLSLCMSFVCCTLSSMSLLLFSFFLNVFFCFVISFILFICLYCISILTNSKLVGPGGIEPPTCMMLVPPNGGPFFSLVCLFLSFNKCHHYAYCIAVLYLSILIMLLNAPTAVARNPACES